MLGSGFWQTRTVEKILVDETYTGCLAQGKTQTIAGKQIKVDRSKWIMTYNTHEPIIDSNQFERIQKRIADIKAQHSKKKHTPYSENIWRGKIFCGNCGRALHRQRCERKKSGARYYFHCLTNTRYERGGCINKSMPEDELLPVVIASIQTQAEILINRKSLLLNALSDKEKQKTQQTELTKLHRFIHRNQTFMSNLYESLVNHVITAEEYQSMREEYSEKISDAVKRIQEIENQQKTLEQNYSDCCDFTEAATEVCKRQILTKELINRLIERINIYQGRRVEILFRFADEYQNREVNVNG